MGPLPEPPPRQPWPALTRRLDDVAALVLEPFHAAPCAVVGAARRTPAGWSLASGAAGRIWRQPREPLAPFATAATVFDLASLSKPLTALTFARCERLGLIARAQRLDEILPWAAGSAAGRAPLDLLMAHRAGLVAHEELFIKQAGVTQASRDEALLRATKLNRPACTAPPPPEGYPPVYSDIGYMLTGAALEECSGRRLDQLVEEQLGPQLPAAAVLGSARQLYAAGESHNIAPTEDVGWRGGVLRGVVHDENAWVLAGEGSAGHAGLFGNVAAVLALGMAIVEALADERPGWLSAAQLGPLLRPRPGGSHAAGFDRRSGATPSSGRLFGKDTFGHLGFTGTSIWIDPHAQLVGVLLTNRVHPTRDDIAIRRARPAVYDAIARAMAS